MTERICYKVGDKASSGRGIASIYGQSASCGVYKDEDGRIHIETISSESTPAEACANRRYDELVAYADDFLPAQAVRKVRDRLGYCLFNGMTAANEASAMACFESAARSIDRAIALRTRLWYLAPATVLAFGVICTVLALSVWLPTRIGARVFVGVVGGVIGSWTSVVQRVGRLEPVTALESAASYGLQGGTRILLGCVFGVLAVAAIAANVVLGFWGDTRAALYLVAFAGGFSERFVPELLRQIEDDALKGTARP
jgi:hypothetical protein